QAFIADRILAEGFLNQVDEARGRFRSFLLTSLDNFSISRFRREKLRKTEHGMVIAEMSGRSPSTEAIADAAWASALIQGVLRDMEAECQRSGRMDLWKVFHGRILVDIYGTGEPVGYERLADELQLSSPMQAANLLVTAKRMYARLLRTAIAEYETDA